MEVKTKSITIFEKKDTVSFHEEIIRLLPVVNNAVSNAVQDVKQDPKYTGVPIKHKMKKRV